MISHDYIEMLFFNVDKRNKKYLSNEKKTFKSNIEKFHKIIIRCIISTFFDFNWNDLKLLYGKQGIVDRQGCNQSGSWGNCPFKSFAPWNGEEGAHFAPIIALLGVRTEKRVTTWCISTQSWKKSSELNFEINSSEALEATSSPYFLYNWWY